MALEKLEGGFIDDYNKLEAYAQELKQSNPRSDVLINISKDALAGGKINFLRTYMCFDALKKGWKSRLRTLIGLNGTFLKDGAKITFISDMQKGLIYVVDKVLPEAQHRYCVRHIESNLCKRWRSGQMRKLMWWCPWSSYDEDFKDQLNKLGKL
ncbi:hypothetical protein KY290_017130 [Solanum tuberosum]|uniref:MULE transposase domain-containing protein n=1 Tax=Solanum tuberosum TaxID=4113 RepID=A0ABQ7VAG4_SOLTU|nr:hypothetical protein KY284_016177 [Solanum tuberosum]KAH0761057.1 hypothetical protein KY290_017130 [Solanum tuberosum]